MRSSVHYVLSYLTLKNLMLILMTFLILGTCLTLTNVNNVSQINDRFFS
jgi:hypothetical protein